MRTVDAGGKRGVDGGNGWDGYAITGCGRFVVRASYKGVAGGLSVGGAGNLRAMSFHNSSYRPKDVTYQIPPSAPLASNTTGFHKPALYNG